MYVAAGGILCTVGFGRDGYGNGIQDFYPRDGVGKRESRIRGNDWGFPAAADATERFSMVRIANSITELRFGRMFNFKEVCRHPVKLLRLLGIKSVALPLPVSSSCHKKHQSKRLASCSIPRLHRAEPLQ